MDCSFSRRKEFREFDAIISHQTNRKIVNSKCFKMNVVMNKIRGMSSLWGIAIVCILLFAGFSIAYAKKSKGSSSEKQEEVSVAIPEEVFSVVESMSEDNKPAVAVVNTSLRDFKNRDVFGWTCNLTIEYKDLANNGMPSQEEYNLVVNWVTQLDSVIKGDPKHPNALFLARETFDGMMDVYWQVYDPEPVHQYLQSIIQGEKYLRELDYRIEKDIQWKKVARFLQDFSKKKKEK